MNGFKRKIGMTIIGVSSLIAGAQTTNFVTSKKNEIKNTLLASHPIKKEEAKAINHAEHEKQFHDKIIQTPAEEIMKLYKEEGLNIIREHTIIEINNIRDSLGLKRVIISERNNNFAQEYIAYCYQHDTIGHTDKEGNNIVKRTEKAGIEDNFCSEILARYTSTIQQSIKWFMEKNSNHWKKIVSPEFQEVGIGYTKNYWGYFFTGNK